MSILSSFTAVATATDHIRLLRLCESRKLTLWEAAFLHSIHNRRCLPTNKQWAVLQRIAAGTPDYQQIAAAALRALPEILSRWLPGGKFVGREYFVINPKRDDRTTGSFSVNTTTGKWADFATGDRGKDIIALAAWLFDLPQSNAAHGVASMLGLSMGDPPHGQ